jgi:NADH-quinone oxidoreductase subunit G
MTLAPETAQIPANPELITLTVDGLPVDVPKGTLIIRAAELLGIQIPRFCDHPLLDPVGACRQCIVEVEGQRKPVASCTTPVSADMVVKTQLSSPVAEKAQRGNMEMLLINHPLDCPICDKGGECPLQNQAMTNGAGESRFVDTKRTYIKPLAISSQVLLDRERCVLCARCTRFSQQIAGDPFIDLFERGALEQVAVYEDEPFQSYFSGNTVQICPVGALTGASYRFRARPFDLVSTPSACEHCASGCSVRTDHRRGKVLRRLAGDAPEVNEEWNCDKGRWAFRYATVPDRITTPLVRNDDTGELVPTSWTEALALAARGLAECRSRHGVGVLTGGRLPVEDAYAYAKFARLALKTNDIDFRARPGSAEEADFLAARVAGTGMTVTYDDLENAPAVLLAGFEPEEESPIVFLRLRKGSRKHGLKVFSIAPFVTGSIRKTSGTLLAARPGDEAGMLADLAGTSMPEGPMTAAAGALHKPGAIILVGERLAEIPGALSAAALLADETGAQLAWIPRRAGERGALEAGALPNLLPGGRPVDDPAARSQVASVWGETPPTARGRDGESMLAAAANGELDALIVGGLDPNDLPDPVAAQELLARVPLLISLEQRHSAVAAVADIVFPVAAVVERSGAFLDWEGRTRPFEQALEASTTLAELRVLHMLAGEMGVALGLPDVLSARREITALGGWDGQRAATPQVPVATVATPGPGEALLATWTELLDAGLMQIGDDHLAGTAKTPRALLSSVTAGRLGVRDGDLVTVRSGSGELTLPLVVTELPDEVVWLPTNAKGAPLRRQLSVPAGSVVRVSAAPAAALIGADS